MHKIGKNAVSWLRKTSSLWPSTFLFVLRSLILGVFHYFLHFHDRLYNV